MLRTKQMGKWYEIAVPEDWNGMTIDEFFKEKWPLPKKMAHDMRTNKKVMVNGSHTQWAHVLTTGSKLQLLLFEDEDFAITPSLIDVDVLYEDEHLIIFNKQPFLNTHPNSPEDQESLANGAAFYLMAKGELRNIRHIHRLDRDTSGAILFSKHALAGALLDKMLENREIKRTYVAIIQGKLKSKKGTIHEPIGRDRHHATRRRVSPSGQEAVTHYKVIKYNQQDGNTAIKCWLDTGKTHQIRVHFSHIGHPLSGDTLYGGKPTFDRQALHAAKLEFIHPLTDEVIVCRAPFKDTPPIFRGINIEEI